MYLKHPPESPWTAELAAKRLREESEWTGVHVGRKRCGRGSRRAMGKQPTPTRIQIHSNI
jgi:hypothetical protein